MVDFALPRSLLGPLDMSPLGRLITCFAVADQEQIQSSAVTSHGRRTLIPGGLAMQGRDPFFATCTPGT